MDLNEDVYNYPTPGSDWLGAELRPNGQTAFRVWAPNHWSVSVEYRHNGEIRRHRLSRETGSGYYSGTLANAGSGTHYRYVLDDGQAYPDPASARQPEGVHGPSEVIDHSSYVWSDGHWQGVPKRDLIIYELHVGTFTNEGTFRAAIDRLQYLLDLGITAIELMPVAQTPGRWNWGYDGVGLFSVRDTYGHPDDLKAFVDACHNCGIAVILDVVYNHLGPEGNYLPKFGPFNSQKHSTPWGDALNYDGKNSEPVRQFIVRNALYWFKQFHMDGLRLDAAHFMQDESDLSILDELRIAIADYEQSCDRHLHLIAETNSHDAELLSEHEGRPAYDAIWVDCLMHSMYSIGAPHVNLVSREYEGSKDLVMALQRGFLYQGRQFARAEDHSADSAFIGSHVTALQTHDAVGNHPHGQRIHQLTSIEFQKAAAALTVLRPSIPLIFMGEESATDSAFPFFADFQDQKLRKAVDAGRKAEYIQHDWQEAPLPSSDQTFWMAKLPTADETAMLDWYRQLIALRKQGLAEGWLSVKHFKSGYDEELDAYWMRFGEGRHVRVYARLNYDDSVEATLLEIEGQIMLATDPSIRNCENRLLLPANEAVIARWT